MIYQVLSIILTHIRGQMSIKWKKFKKKNVTSHLQQTMGDLLMMTECPEPSKLKW